MPEGAELLDPPRLHATPRFMRLVQAVTWGGLALESVIALLWLAPIRHRALLLARHGAILLFCLATYAFAPVAGFGWLLLVMGLANVSGRPALGFGPPMSPPFASSCSTPRSRGRRWS